MTKTRALVQVVAVVVVVVFAIGIWSAGEPVKLGWLRFFSASVVAATLILGVWDRWLWRLTVAQK
jgi:hypothetical protein